MNKAKKFLVGLLAFASVSAFALGLTGCEDEKPSAGTGTGNGTNTEQGGGLGGLGGGSSNDENDEQGGNTGNEETHTHVYLDLLNVNYIAQEATCTSGTIYYQSCACGAKGTDTFTYGDPIAHEYDQEVATDAYFFSAADCYNKAQYYYSCKCGAKGNWTFSYGDYAHTFDQQVLTPNNYWQDEDYYVANAGDCTHKVQYYYSCTCGEKGTETFEGNDYGHCWKEEYTVNGDEHWIDCENCDETKENGTHVAMDDGYCVCDTPISSTVGITYDFSSDGTYAEVIGYTGSSTRIIIADTYQNKPVKNIYDNAFENTNIRSVVIPDSVTTIGDSAFSDCDSLTSVTIPDSVTTIGRTAFGSCGRLTSITIPDSVTMIGNQAFYLCYNLTSVTIPDSVTTIGSGVFSGCYNLTNVTIPDSVTTIGGSAFADCPDELFTVYENVKYLGNENNPYYALIETVTDTYSSYTVHAQTKIIANSAFSNCTRLTSVTIPDSVTTIGDDAFWRCDSLTSVAIGDSVTTIGNEAFSWCSSLTSVTIGNSVTTIGKQAFGGCDSLTSVTFTGTIAEWNAISKGSLWKSSVPATKVVCSDGEVAL